MNRHCLTQIDLEARTAVCSVCGLTEIHMTRPRSGTSSQVSCVQQTREGQEDMQDRNQPLKSARRPKHILTEIDEEKCTAVCAICGPTDVYAVKKKGYMSYRCASYLRALARQTDRHHIVNPYARVHILSEIDEEKRTAICAKCGPVRIEWYPSPSSATGHPGTVPGTWGPRFKNKQPQQNTRIVSEYKRRHACKRCGSLAVVEPYKFDFFELQYPREQRIPALVEKAEPEELLAEPEKRDMYCKECLRLVNNAFAEQHPGPRIPSIPYLLLAAGLAQER